MHKKSISAHSIASRPTKQVSKSVSNVLKLIYSQNESFHEKAKF